jgi:hypothetical protein
MFLGFTRSSLASHICSTDSIPWVHHSREEGSLDYDGRLVRLRVYLNFNTNIHRQQSSYMTSNKSPSKKHPQIFPTKNPRKGSENHQKGKTGGTQPSLEEPRWIIYTYHERFIQGLASAWSSFPLTRSHHEALKLVLEILRKIGRENRKTKWARVPRDGCHPLTPWVIWWPKD